MLSCWEWVKFHVTRLVLSRVNCYKARPPHVLALFCLKPVPFSHVAMWRGVVYPYQDTGPMLLRLFSHWNHEPNKSLYFTSYSAPGIFLIAT
jgi:hypothetical protein